ncbi:probable serine/threonine-protein kinase SIS8 [Punica granatum]|uniref:non-specific serine/threonine protein kinase n=1 Tax=Punica granatum TaxID=22663 RepID=A0A218VUF4_PUNGR|nr:probable serine/threonine-protein kinase SIS8 [Punica granatum]OWM63963.1 hypothetical protein CDL15_Pgr006189 [Punica granatum]
MRSTAGVGDPAAGGQYSVLVDRCRMLEATQAELRQQFSELLLEKEEEGDLPGGRLIPGYFSGGSPYRSILESIGHAVHVCSASTGEIVYWNRSAENLYGWKDYEVIGKRMDQLLVSEERRAHFQNILEQLSPGRPLAAQFPFKRRSGETFMAMTTKSLLYEDGEPVGVIIVSSDAAHFNSTKLVPKRINQDSANGLPRGLRLKIKWHPRLQIASTVSNLASKVLLRKSADRTRHESAARWNDGSDVDEDDLLKKPVKLTENFLERLHIGRNRGCICEHDESCQPDGIGDRPENNPLPSLKASTSSHGTVCVEKRKENLVDSNSFVHASEGDKSVANKSMDQTCIRVSERECCQCFSLPKPEDLVASRGSKVSEKMGGNMALQKDREMADRAQRDHEEKQCSSSGGSIGSYGTASSRGDSELSSLVDCEIQWEDLQIGEEIGQGSYAVVHRGIWKGSDVAIKVYCSNEYGEKILRDYKKEIDIMKRLRHPNVLLFMGAVYSQERLAIVTEFLPRGSLFKALHKNKQAIDIRRRMRMALDVVRGMNYLHHRNPPILHRDLKSSNLLVDRNWNVKAGDFGLSRLKNASLLATKSGRGTPQWMAPEVLRNEPSNEKSDVFSFGVVLWELMTQSIPWNNLNPLQVVGVVGFMDRRLDIPGGVDPEIASIIRDCWLSDPDQRPSFEDILKRMTSFLQKTMAASRSEEPG